MDFEKIIRIKEFRISITVPAIKRSDGLLAFGELNIIDETGETFCKAKGFRIREKIFSGKLTKTVDFPAFKAGAGYYKSFIIEDKQIYAVICKEFIRKYEIEIGEGYSVENNETNNFNDIPF
ncbi:MAG: hypothetical protein AAB966_03245 [Patescibacteria group bacterium]